MVDFLNKPEKETLVEPLGESLGGKHHLPSKTGTAATTGRQGKLEQAMARRLTCSLVCCFWTCSLPLLPPMSILGRRRPRMKSATLIPRRWLSFWAAAL